MRFEMRNPPTLNIILESKAKGVYQNKPRLTNATRGWLPAIFYGRSHISAVTLCPNYAVYG